MYRRVAPFLLAAFLIPSSGSAITLDQIDTFEDGTVQGWVEGSTSPNMPTNVATDGPAGAGDHYLSNQSSGIFGPGGKLVMFNATQWAGDYVAAGVERISLDVRNTGNADVQLRIGVEGLNTRFVSTTAHPVSPSAEWQNVVFDLSEMSLVGGAASLLEVLGAVDRIRILSANTVVWQGDQIVGWLCVDNIHALDDGVPVEPTTWGQVKDLYR